MTRFKLQPGGSEAFSTSVSSAKVFFFRRSSDSSVMSESMLQGEDPTFQVEVKQETFGPQVATKCCREGGSWCRRLMTKSACVGDQVKYGKIIKKDLVWECSRSEKLPLRKSSVNRQCTAVWQIYSCVWACPWSCVFRWTSPAGLWRSDVNGRTTTWVVTAAPTVIMDKNPWPDQESLDVVFTGNLASCIDAMHWFQCRK